jgi:uncharacterized protein (TIGR03435 family)
MVRPLSMTRTTLICFLFVIKSALGEAPAFEVASVKPNNSKDGHSETHFNSDKDAVKLTMVNVNMLRCIQTAYGVKPYQIVGPDWLKSESYDIVGTVPEHVSREKVAPMLQTLLADRFKLTLHRETKVLPIYELVAGKNGAKIKAAEPDGGSSGVWETAGQLTAKNEKMEDFATVLSRVLDRPVVDKSGLAGVFNFAFEYTREDQLMRQDSVGTHAANTPTAPSIFTALEEKLGLKLQAAKAPVEILIIDHLEKVPTEN